MGMTLEQMRMLEPTEAEVWAHAQKDYEGGVGVGEICARYGLARATVYQRAQVWRAASGAIDLDAPPPQASDLAAVAWRRLAAAVEAGRIQEALCWRTLVATLEARAAKDAWAKKVKGLSLREASDTLIAECDRVVADERERKAWEAQEARSAKSLDTPLPPSETPSASASPASDEAEVTPYSAEEVRDWRAWAAFSERFPPEKTAGETLDEWSGGGDAGDGDRRGGPAGGPCP